MDIVMHPLLKKINIVMHEIEKCGASEQLTEASTVAADFAMELERYIDENKEKLNFIRRLFDECPDLEKDGLGEFDGHFLTYGKFLSHIDMATGETRAYGNDPLELIVDLVNEKDDAIESANNKTRTTVMGFVKAIRETTGAVYDARSDIDDCCPGSLNFLETLGLQALTRNIKEGLDRLLVDVQGIDNAVNGVFPKKV